jgi:hypothetical protein
VLVDFLCANADIFMWSPLDMPGIPREVVEHSLDILPHSRDVQQRLRRFDERKAPGDQSGAAKAPRHRIHQGSFLPYVASQSCTSLKKWEVEDVCRLYRFE